MKLCFLCLQKCEEELTAFKIERVHKIVKKDLDFNNGKVPRGVCDYCRKLLRKFDQGDQKVSLPALFNFDITQIKSHTRNSTNCEFLICKIGKLKLNKKHPFKDKQKESKNTCSSSTLRALFPQQTEERGIKCLTIIGLSHFVQLEKT